MAQICSSEPARFLANCDNESNNECVSSFNSSSNINNNCNKDHDDDGCDSSNDNGDGDDDDGHVEEQGQQGTQ